MKTSTFPHKESREFENQYHINRKKKAETLKQPSKNKKELGSVYEEEDIDQYLRYIK